VSSAAQSWRAAGVSALSGVLLAASLVRAAPLASASAAEPAADVAEAREAAALEFERGLSLARDGRYAEAKEAFLAAYAAHPHYLVLYNVAQADLRLGNSASALAYLERFLQEGAAALSPEQRAAVQARVSELRGQLSASTKPAPEPAAPPVEHANPSRTAPETPPLAAPLGSSVATQDTTRKPWGIALGVSGAVLIGLASSLYLWNDARHSQWSEGRQHLDALPNREQALRTDLTVWRQAKANNELLASIQRVDVAALVLGGLGAVALGAGAWALFAPSAAREPALVASGTTLTWRTVW
jgi:tetratricopeptide (TPR) repeat protein